MSRIPTNPILENVYRALSRESRSPLTTRPPILPPRVASAQDEEIDLLVKEINALSGVARRIRPGDVEPLLKQLAIEQDIKKATTWATPLLTRLGIATHLQRLGVELVSPVAGKQTLAECDLGVTEVDFALPETGTLGLLSSPLKPRAVSLLPRIHLAILRPEALRSDLHQVFLEAKQQHYLVFITGPSRTADIELTVTLGVHGPKALHVWVLD